MEIIRRIDVNIHHDVEVLSILPRPRHVRLLIQSVLCHAVSWVDRGIDVCRPISSRGAIDMTSTDQRAMRDAVIIYGR